MSGIEKPVKVMLTASKTSRKPYTVEPLIVAEQPKPQPAQKQPSPNVEQEATLAAERGMDELKLFWGQLTKAQQKALSPRMPALKETASAADAVNAEIDDATETAPLSPPHGNDGAQNEAGNAPTLSASSLDDMEF